LSGCVPVPMQVCPESSEKQVTGVMALRDRRHIISACESR
jgi:hypothetical protein